MPTIFRHLFVLFFAMFLALPASAQEGQRVDAIDVSGNQRIESSTIISYLGLKQGGTVSRQELDEAVRKLYETGFFADVDVSYNEPTLSVNVTENPSINRVAFEGNSKIKDEDLDKEISLKSRSIYSRTKVQNDVKRLLDVYRRNGRYSAVVEPKVIQLEQNRVDLVYEIKEGPVTEIRDITFIGNKAFTDSQLQSVINSAIGRWYNFLTDNDKYDPDRLLYDQELLRRYYRSQGYADFEVKSAIAELTPERDAFYLTFTVEEGERYDFGKVDVKSELKQKAPIDFSADMKTVPGEEYNGNQIDNTIDAMTATLGNRGFAFVDIKPVENRRTAGDEKLIDITYEIKEGPRVYVERINITGNVRTLDEVVRREFRLAEGDPYNTAKLRRTEQRLNNLGYFEKVTIDTEQGSTPDRININVDVQEKSTGEITIGAGYSTVDGALADLGVRERNLMGRGQDLRFRTMIATKRQQYDISFTEPYFMDRDLMAGADIYKTTQDFRTTSSFDRDALGGRVRLGYDVTEKLKHQVYYGIEQNEISNVRDDASRYVKDQEGEYLTSLVGQSFIYDGRNNRFEPTEGGYFRLNQEVAGLGGDDKFLRHEAFSEYYIPLSEKWTLGFMGSGGYIFGLGQDVRINQRFFVGGRDLRGFENGGIGPRDLVSDDALGGNTYYTGSAEVRFPLGFAEDLGFMGAAFVDVGDLWNLDENGPGVVDGQGIRVSPGVGIAWSSPFGPIRIDFAKPIVKKEYDDAEIFSFSFGTRF